MTNKDEIINDRNINVFIRQIIDLAGSLNKDDILYARDMGYRKKIGYKTFVSRESYLELLKQKNLLSDSDFLDACRTYIRHYYKKYCKKYGLYEVLEWL